MKKLSVNFRGWGQDWRLGTLAEHAGVVAFEYSGEALNRGVEFSGLNLKLRPEAYSNFPRHLSNLPGLVSDSLPDGWGLLLMDRVFQKAGRQLASVSPLDRLAFIGDRAMGALSYAPADDISLDEQDLSLMDLSLAVQAVIEDRDTEALKMLAIVGGSPHGARPKALVQYDASANSISTNPHAPGMPWVVKFPAGNEHIEVCAIEHVYSDMAELCGIKVPARRHFKFGKAQAAFGIERFDRFNGLRVPVQSFAAALHADFRIPSLDYQTILRATRFFTLDESQVEAAFRLCVFNVVFNNRDDHAKNFSLRMNADMRWEMSPAYDLTFCPGPGGYHQTSVMGEALQPSRQHLLELGKIADIRTSRVAEIIDQTIEVSTRIQGELLNSGLVRRKTVSEICAAIALNAGRLTEAHVRGPKQRAKSLRTSPPNLGGGVLGDRSAIKTSADAAPDRLVSAPLKRSKPPRG